MSVLHNVHSEAYKLDVLSVIFLIIVYAIDGDVCHGSLTLSFAILNVSHGNAGDGTESVLSLVDSVQVFSLYSESMSVFSLVTYVTV
jgi:hypothetical protein